MELKRRFTFFGLGFSIGILLLLFFLNGKKASCNFLPNERVLNMLRYKHRIYSDEVLQLIANKKIDSTGIANLLLNGDVDFSKSNVHQEPCRDYWIDGYDKEKKISMFVQNCDTIITIQQIYLPQEN